MKLGSHTRTLKRDGRKALVAFLTAGYPDAATFKRLVLAASDAGCDVIEIGIPFSDPIADGPVIQASSTAALAAGASLESALQQSAQLAPQIKCPLVFMSYLNPILNRGLETFTGAATSAGITGVILPDVPLEESAEVRATLAAGGLDYIDLLAPTSTDERIARITKAEAGFLYLVSVAGVTGSGTASSDDLGRFVGRVRQATDAPAYVGFGITTPEQAASTTALADGVIIGSQLIRLINDGHADGAAERVGAFLRDVRSAIDEV